ncbi:MAG: aminoacyl-histidine dipeptidase [Bacillota bacterium]
MSGVLKNLNPEPVFRYFEEISRIPRGSGNERAISDYLVEFANKHNLEIIRDDVLNVTIKKPAAPGYEKAPTVIIQGHMDMVNEKNKETVHDFDKDPIKLRIVDDMIYATDTTLGADNGIAIAYALAILESKEIPHPALEVLLTTNEESTMGGALNFDASHMKGSFLINIDSEEEGKLLVSSAGGTKARIVLPINWEVPKCAYAVYKLIIGGLKGGHSGIDIDKGRGNASKLMGRLLSDISKRMELYVAEVNGGLKSNAITREAEAVICINPAYNSRLEELVKNWDKTFKNELRATDSEVYAKAESYLGKVGKVFSADSMNKLISAMVILPSGVQSMSMEIPGLVESSTNLGVVQTLENEVYLVNEIRSSVRSKKYAICNKVKTIAEVLGGNLEIDSDYPEWEYNPDSRLRSLFMKVYKKKYGKDAEIIAIHAGLECGVLIQKMEGLDAISIGPNLYDVHTPQEHLNIPSTQRVWEYLLDVLKEMKNM